jgi:microcystin-dependent protein
MKISYPCGVDTEQQIERIIEALNTLDENNFPGIFDMEKIMVKAPYNVVNRVRDKSGYVTPVGGVIEWTTATAPEGWLICNGASLLKSEYLDLFNVIGTTFGSVDGSHFNIPDCRDRMTIGTSGTYALAATGGSATVAHTHSTPAHEHIAVTTNGSGDLLSGDGNTVAQQYGDYQIGAVYAVLSAHAHKNVTGHTDTSGSGTSGAASDANNLSPYISLNKIIKY